MASITGIAHVGIRVHDMDRSRAFYGPINFWEGNSSFFVRDPDRNVVEFNQNAGLPPPF